MKKTILILLSALVLVSCAKEISRKEVSREYVSAHTNILSRPVIIGKSIVNMPYIDFVPEHYDVTYEVTYDNGKTRRIIHSEDIQK